MEPVSPGMEKPTLDVDMRSNRKLVEKRKRSWNRFMKKVLDLPRKERKKASEALHTWRKKQRNLLGHRDIEDPNPFDKTYVFYCLDI